MSINLKSLEFLKPHQVKNDSESLAYYGRDWTTYFDIKASVILFPESTEDVVKIVKWANETQTALVPSGGRTGLSGGACATQNEAIVSFEKMNRILDFNSFSQTVRVQPGVITEELQKYAAEKNLFYPVDFAARGSSHIGGNIATNAGGIKVVRYGLTRDWVTALEVVTGKGEILHLNNNLVKNATGLDLRHLFIGSEGILGFITEATMRLAPSPAEVKVVLLATPELSTIMQIFAEFKTRTTLNAFEFFSDLALEKVIASTQLPNPFPNSSPYYIVAEVECKNETDEQNILNLFEVCAEKGLVIDGHISQSEQQAKTFWRYREDISESLAKYSPYKNDISVQIAKVPDFMTDLDQILKASYPTWEVVWFGHIGDGNLHINILRPQGMTKEDFVKECQKVDVLIFNAIQQHQGSISAEHGVGLTKKKFLNYTRSNQEIELMKQMKKIFDPNNIMNPGKVIDSI